MTLSLVLFLALVVLLGVIVLLAAALFWIAGARAAEPPALTVTDDEWMAVADAVAEPEGDVYDTDSGGVCLEGFTAEESAVLRANYEPMCDDERIELGVAFESIARREGLAGMVRRVLAEDTAQAGGASS